MVDDTKQDTSGFWTLLVIAEVLAIAAIVLEFIWLQTYRGGFQFPNYEPLYNYNCHPLFVTIGFVFLYGNGLLIYRIFRYNTKKSLKLTHAFIMVLALFFAILSNLPLTDPPHFYTLHAWIGYAAYALFIFQWFAGLVTYLFPGLDAYIKKAYMPVHVMFGILTFGLVCAACLTGITEKLLLTFEGGNWFYDLEQGVANLAGICILVFTILVVMMAMKDSYKRLPLQEETQILLKHPPSYCP